MKPKHCETRDQIVPKKGHRRNKWSTSSFAKKNKMPYFILIPICLEVKHFPMQLV